jgi:outer membrane lipoprotein-sorting protein
MKSEKRWMSYWRKSALCLLPYLTVLCLVAAGCTTPVQREEADTKAATADELTALLEQRERAVQTMKGLFSAKVRGGIIPITTRVEGAVYYRRPSAMRLRGFTAIGSELFEFLQTDDQFTLRLPTMGRVLSGHPSDMSEMGKLARPFQLSVWAMSGVLGTGTINAGDTVRVVDEGDRHRLEVFRASPSGGLTIHRRLWFNRQTRLVVKEDRLTELGEIDATIVYEDFRPVGEMTGLSISGDGQLLRPFKISLEDGQGRGSVQVTFHELIPNATLKPSELAHASNALPDTGRLATGTDGARQLPNQDLP